MNPTTISLPIENITPSGIVMNCSYISKISERIKNNATLIKDSSWNLSINAPIGKKSKLILSGSGNIEINGTLEEEVVIEKTGSGNLHINVVVPPGTRFICSGAGNIVFAHQPPECVLQDIRKSRLSYDVIIKKEDVFGLSDKLLGVVNENQTNSIQWKKKFEAATNLSGILTNNKKDIEKINSPDNRISGTIKNAIEEQLNTFENNMSTSQEKSLLDKIIYLLSLIGIRERNCRYLFFTDATADATNCVVECSNSSFMA